MPSDVTIDHDSDEQQHHPEQDHGVGGMGRRAVDIAGRREMDVEVGDEPGDDGPEPDDADRRRRPVRSGESFRSHRHLLVDF
jgi:hypothetical protein